MSDKGNVRLRVGAWQGVESADLLSGLGALEKFRMNPKQGGDQFGIKNLINRSACNYIPTGNGNHMVGKLGAMIDVMRGHDDGKLLFVHNLP